MPDTGISPNTIYTIGHSRHPMDTFLTLLTDRSITLLIDIRSVPYSRFSPQYRKENLQKACEGAKIRYTYLGDELGGRITDPECYIGRVLPADWKNPAAHIDLDILKNKPWFRHGINLVMEEARLERVAIMCSEEDPDRCHRSILVGKVLEEEGCKLIHIRKKT
jgi:uncharacterized protein (DUF488 family)